MAASPKRVYWDACAWIALIQNEKSPLRPAVPNIGERSAGLLLSGREEQG